MTNKIYFGNAFSLQMVDDNVTIRTSKMNPTQIAQEVIPAVNSGEITSCVGHPDTAAVLGVPCSRVNVHLYPGDVLFVAQLQGGRLPEGATTLPEGFTFKFIKVTVEA